MLISKEQDGRKKKLLSMISVSNRTMLNEVSNYADYLTIKRGGFCAKPSVFNLEQLVTSGVEIFKLQADAKKIKISISYERDMPKLVKTDKTRIMQVLRVFVSNSIKFTMKGHIKISLHFNAAAKWLEFEIRDSGVGISEVDILKLFQPYAKISDTFYLNKHGVGLNLHIAKLIVKKLNGNVGVTSTKGQGSKFWFSIEAENADPVAASDINLELGVIQEETLQDSSDSD
jgi:signal transduction histidine kinase